MISKKIASSSKTLETFLEIAFKRISLPFTRIKRTQKKSVKKFTLNPKKYLTMIKANFYFKNVD